MLSLRYGIDSSLSLELDSEALLALCDAPRGEPIERVAEAVMGALAEPLDFPPLVQACLPGDKVVLALDRGVPGAAAIVRQTVEVLLGGGVGAADITLVCAPAGSAGPDPLGELPAAVRKSVACRVHDPRNRPSLSYLAAAADGRPIYVNRAIHDADLVIPIGVLRLADSLGYHGAKSALFPAFSDAESLERFRSPKAAGLDERNRLRKQADEVSWLLGVRFTIQVVPGATGEILHVLAGDLDAVSREGSRLCDAAWSYAVPERASLVVAAIEGDAAEQTWENVGRALAAASHALAEDGAVVICSELAEPFSPALQRIVGADDLDDALHEIARERLSDALVAAELVRALKRGRVYLVSRLDDESVEELGVLPVDRRGVSRVAGRHPSCIVLAGAQNARARPRSEPAVEHSAPGPKSRS
ncbi:MAG: lactate racemase domain-containing protein [Pirellulales bacterium]